MKHILATAAFLASFSGLAAAATLSYHGTTTHTLFGFDLTATTGLADGSSIFKMRREGDGLYLNGNSDIRLTYLGKEAGNTNVFRMPTPLNQFNTSIDAVGSTRLLAHVTGGLLSSASSTSSLPSASRMVKARPATRVRSAYLWKVRAACY